MSTEVQDKRVDQDQEPESVDTGSSDRASDQPEARSVHQSDNGRAEPKKPDPNSEDQVPAEGEAAPQPEDEMPHTGEDAADVHDEREASTSETMTATEKETERSKSTRRRQRLNKELEKLRQASAKLAEENSILKDKYLRLAAEMENFRKRTDRDLRNRVRNAFADLVSEFLPVLDDLERPLSADDEHRDYDSLLNGIRIIHQKLTKVLEARGVKVMQTVGNEFDPNLHEAITQIEADGKPSGIVLEEHLKGYTLDDRVLRAAKVIVSK